MPQISSSSTKPSGNCGGVCSSDAFRGRKQDRARVAGGRITKLNKIRNKENRQVECCRREEGCQEGGEQSQARREAAWSLGVICAAAVLAMQAIRRREPPFRPLSPSSKARLDEPRLTVQARGDVNAEKPKRGRLSRPQFFPCLRRPHTSPDKLCELPALAASPWGSQFRCRSRRYAL
jgi:hypothetical protein